MAGPSVAFLDWFPAAFDPVLLLVAGVLGWKADQFGKVFIAAMAALVIAVLVSWLVHSMGLPWVAPVGRDLPMLLPVRTIAALLAASLAFGVSWMVRRNGDEIGGR